MEAKLGVSTLRSTSRGHARNVRSSFRDALDVHRGLQRQRSALAGPAVPWAVVAHGIDTVSFAWRDFDVVQAENRLMRTAPDPATGELVGPSRRGAAAWLTDALSGARVGVIRAAGGARLLWCEARLSALCSADVNDHSLATGLLLLDGAAAATKLANRLGLPPRESAPVLMRRLDLASDVEFVRAAGMCSLLWTWRRSSSGR